MSSIFTTATLRRLFLAGTLILSLVPTGCGGGGSNGSSGNSPSAPPPQLSVSATAPNGLTATLAENAATIPVGGTVTYTLTLTNNTSRSVTFSPGAGVSTLAPSVGGTVAVFGDSNQLIYPAATSSVSAPGNGYGPAVALGPGQSVSGAISVPSGIFTSAGRYSTTATFQLLAGSPGAGVSVVAGPLALTVQ